MNVCNRKRASQRSTDGAARIAFKPDRLPIHVTRIEHQQAASQGGANACQQANRFTRLHGANNANQGREYAHDSTTFFFKFRLIGKQAVITGTIRQPEIETGDLPVKTNRSTRYQRRTRGHTGFIDRMPRCKIIAAIENDIRHIDQARQRYGINAFCDRVDTNARIDCEHGPLRRMRLVAADGVIAVNNLPLQIGKVHGIAIGNRNAPDAGGGQVHQCRRAQTTRTDNQRMRVQQGLLRLGAKLIEQNVPAVAQEVLIVHGEVALPRIAQAALASGISYRVSPP